MNTNLSSVPAASAGTPFHAPAAAADTPASTSKAASAADPSAAGLDTTTHQPAAIRFPWLSRLTAALEALSVNHWPFKSLQVTGENLDKSA